MMMRRERRREVFMLSICAFLGLCGWIEPLLRFKARRVVGQVMAVPFLSIYSTNVLDYSQLYSLLASYHNSPSGLEMSKAKGIYRLRLCRFVTRQK